VMNSDATVAASSKFGTIVDAILFGH